MKRQNVPKTSKPSNVKKSDHSNVKTGSGRFSFRNGDSYEGKYEVDIRKRTLVKQDQGVYVTDNFDVYDGKWSGDKFSEDKFYIRYNNNAQYKGKIDANGAMNGTGTYIFPDGSALTATWSQNKPIADFVYREPLGHEWTVDSVSDNQISFTTGNHFWNEICKETLERGSSSVQRQVKVSALNMHS